MNDNNQSNYWLDILISRIITAHPTGELIVSSGISPSGPYHVGHGREILTADSIYRGLREAGRQVRHLHFVDAHDTLRKRYPYLPESYEQEAGKPLYKVPAPDGKSENYAKQYFSDYQKSAKKLGIEMEIIWTNELYESGVFSDAIGLCLRKRDEIAKILFDISGREVSEDWQPIQILDQSTGKLNTAKFIGYDHDTQKAHYLGEDQNEYFADASKGQIKLDWRLDWTARWKLYGVMIEGFGREHATKGGSYDTGVVLAKEIFAIDAPIPVPYDTVPFSHIVTLYQTARGEADVILEMLERTGHKAAVQTQSESILRELKYVKNWIDRYAPENIKFEIQKKLPELEISKAQHQFLAGLLDKIKPSAMQADEIHKAVYDSAMASDLKPAEAFKLIYRLFLNKDQGPKVGFFLSSLDKDFVLNRIALKG